MSPRSAFCNIAVATVALMLLLPLELMSEEKPFKRKRRTGLRITEPKELTGPKSFSCYPKDAKPAEKDEFTFEVRFEEAGKCKAGFNSVVVAGEGITLKSSAEGILSANCKFGQTVKLDFGETCKFTLYPISESGKN